MFSATSLEAQKLISVSIGKMNASRVTRTGASLHRSLLVATVLHKARNIYFEEERERVAKFPPPEVTVTPVCHVNNPHLNINTLNPNVSTENKRSECLEDEVAIPECISEQSKLPLAEANTDNNITNTTNTTTTVTSVTNSSTVTTSTSNFSHSRKRRRVSDQETAAAVSSILPKRLRSELREDIKSFERCTSDGRGDAYTLIDYSTKIVNRDPEESAAITSDQMEETHSSASLKADSCTASSNDHLPRLEDVESAGSSRLHDSSPEEKSGSSSEDSDSDDENSGDTPGVGEEMEVDQLTSLVSFFSFSQSQQSEYCLSPIHSTGPHIVALTA